MYDDSCKELIAFANLVGAGINKFPSDNSVEIVKPLDTLSTPSMEIRRLDISLIANGILAGFLFWLVSQPIKYVGGYIFRPDVKVFVSLLIWYLIMMISPRLRTGSVVLFLLSIISGIISTWLSNIH